MNRQVRSSSHQSKKVADYFLVVGWNHFEQSSCSNDVPLSNETVISPPSTTASNHSEQQSTPPSRRHASRNEENIFSAEIIDRYPLQDLDDFPFPQGIPLFCFPTGFEVKTKPKSPCFYSFVSTSEDGTRILGCCLRFYEHIPPQYIEDAINYLTSKGFKGPIGESLYLPKCLCVISKWPFLMAFKKVLCGFYRLWLQQNSTSSSINTIPLERYICNFIDDVPAPPWGKLDVIYYLNDEPITFRCPPFNEPNGWNSFHLFPLFECLDPENIIVLFNMILTERQVVFISSQYYLLCACTEAITSLMYPITWAHAYIPVLPLELIGVLGAPFPYILGMKASFLNHKDCVFNSVSARVYLDENRIEYGDEFTPLPPLPERRAKKLLNCIYDAAPVFSSRGSDWATIRLPYFDDAFSPLAEQPKKDWRGQPVIDESRVREGFLKFFVSILINYRKYLVYTAPSSHPLAQFRPEDFLAEHPTDWQPFLQEFIATQQFSLFVDERVSDVVGSRDVIFFDESIDAKRNRYTFRIRNIDTPFLLNNTHKHTKTYVAISPDTSNLSGQGRDNVSPEPTPRVRFPRLRDYLFVSPRKVKIPFDPFSTFNVGWSSDRLKRMSMTSSSSSSSEPLSQGAGASSLLSPAACIYSIYVVCLSHSIIHMGSRKGSHRKLSTVGLLSTSQLLDEFGPTSTILTDDSNADRILKRKMSADMSSQLSLDTDEDTPEIVTIRTAALALGLQMAFVALKCLSRLDQAPDRCSTHAGCAATSSGQSIIIGRLWGDLIAVCRAVDLLVFINCEGLLPDRQILNAVARAYSTDPSFAQIRSNGGKSPCFSRPLSVTDVLTIEDWRSIRVQPTNGTSNGNSVGAVPSTLPPRPSAPLSTSSSSKSSFTSFIFGETETPRGNGTVISNPGTGSTTASYPPQGEATRKTEGRLLFPQLQWSQLDPQHLPIFTASKQLNRLVRHSEILLWETFPDLVIDIQHPVGMGCPSRLCGLHRPLTVSEAYAGFKYGDPNTYTTRCFNCHTAFVPRFTVTSHRLRDDEEEREVWCELLSPWTLRKEVYTTIFQDGIDSMLGRDFRTSSPQRAVLFWNLIVVFRLTGLPYSFLLSEGDFMIAFPPNPNASETSRRDRS